jgi:hypothetical protein
MVEGHSDGIDLARAENVALLQDYNLSVRYCPVGIDDATRGLPVFSRFRPDPLDTLGILFCDPVLIPAGSHLRDCAGHFQVVAHDHAALHNKFYALHLGDIL